MNGIRICSVCSFIKHNSMNDWVLGSVQERRDRLRNQHIISSVKSKNELEISIAQVR